jgi:peptidoglycan biosynthesis protein MviN/MurJ (putative lipid II flippase)
VFAAGLIQLLFQLPALRGINMLIDRASNSGIGCGGWGD